MDPKKLTDALPKDLLIDLDDRLRAEALKAFEMVRDRSGLDKKRSRELEGQARFRMMEQSFENVCAKAGGQLLEGGLIPGTDLKVFQPFMRFAGRGSDGTGVILGLATMPDAKSIPTKNRSRVAGVSLNYHLSPRLDFDSAGPKIGDIFALFLVARDKSRGGKIEEVAVGVVSSDYQTLLFYEPLPTFLAGYTAGGQADEAKRQVADAKKSAKPIVSLKKKIKPFVPPEGSEKKGDDEAGAS
jgi:hypothetical protein